MYSEGGRVNELTSRFIAHSPEPVTRQINCTPYVSENSAIDFFLSFSHHSALTDFMLLIDTHIGGVWGVIVCLTMLLERNM